MDPIEEIGKGLSRGYWLDMENGQYKAKEGMPDNSRYVSIFRRLYDDMMQETSLGTRIRSLLHCKVVHQTPVKNDFNDIALCVTPLYYYRLVGETILKRQLESDYYGDAEDKASFFYNYISLWKQLRNLPSLYTFDIAPPIDTPKHWDPHHLFFRFPPIYDTCKEMSVLIPELEANCFYSRSFGSVAFLLDIMKEIDICKRLNRRFKAKIFSPLSHQYETTGLLVMGSDIALKVNGRLYNLKEASVDAFTSSVLSLEPVIKLRGRVKERRFQFVAERYNDLKFCFKYLPESFSTVTDLLDLLEKAEEKGINVSGDCLCQYLLTSGRPFVQILRRVYAQMFEKIQSNSELSPDFSSLEKQLQQSQIAKVESEIEEFKRERKAIIASHLEKKGAAPEEIKAAYYDDIVSFVNNLEDELRKFLLSRQQDLCRNNYNFLRYQLFVYVMNKGWVRPDFIATRRGQLEFLCLRGFIERKPVP